MKRHVEKYPEKMLSLFCGGENEYFIFLGDRERENALLLGGESWEKNLSIIWGGEEIKRDKYTEKPGEIFGEIF